MSFDNLILFWYHNGYRIFKMVRTLSKEKKELSAHVFKVFSVFDLDFLSDANLKLVFCLGSKITRR